MSSMKMERAINLAGVVTALNGVFALIFSVMAIGGQPVYPGFDGWGIIGAAVQLGLAYGILRRSRICAVITLSILVIAAFFLIEPVLASSISVIVLAVWLLVLIRGTIAVFKYHSDKMSQDNRYERSDGKLTDTAQECSDEADAGSDNADANAIEARDCPHCGVQGMFLMSDGRCPNCKNLLNSV